MQCSPRAVALVIAVVVLGTGCVRAAEPVAGPSASSIATAPPSPTPSPIMGHTITGDPGELVGAISVPKLGLKDYPMHMGTTDELLMLGVGVYTNAATPGNGNVATAGHRVTPVLGSWHGPYYDLDLLEAGDRAFIEYAGWRWTFRWRETIITTPDDVTVLDDGRADLTMTACHPKGSLAERIVAFWDLVGGEPLVA